MNNPEADLHLHTRFSDGTDTPEEVVERVHKAGFRAFAITDHDNIDCFDRAKVVADRLDLEIIPGIEMSASIKDLDVHILAYLFDRTNEALIQHLETQQARRVSRVYETVKRLAAVGVNISAEEVLALAGEGTVGRPHVARVLKERGYVTTVAEAFERFLGNSGPGYVPGSPLLPEEIIRVIRQAGGVAVLAHPIYLKQDSLIDTFVGYGLGGLEVYHSSHNPDMIRHYDAIAKRLQLVKTGGSDYHGQANKEGVVIGMARVPYACVEALKQRQAEYRTASRAP